MTTYSQPILIYNSSNIYPSYSPNRKSVNNKREYRKITYCDNSNYEGEMLNGLRDGYGKLKFSDNAYYEG